MSERINDTSSHQVGENKSPTKRTPSKRISRAQRESEELIKNMGGNLDVEGGRKTRSSTRGRTPSTPSTPTPAKKPKISGTPRRGRPKRNIALDDDKTESDGESGKTEESLKSKDKEGVDSKDEHSEVDASDKKNEVVVNKEHNEDESKKVEPSLPSIAEESSEAKEDETDGKKEEHENNNQSEKTDDEVVKKTVDQPTSNNKDKVDIKDDAKSTIPVVEDNEVEPMEVDGSEKVEEKSSANVVENNLTKTEEAITIDSSPESEDRSDDVVEVPDEVSKESVPATEKPDDKETTKSVENCENSTDNKSIEVEKEATKTDDTVEESKNESKCEKNMKTLSQGDTVQTCN